MPSLVFLSFCFTSTVDKTIRTNKFCKATSEFRTGFHQFMPEAWLEQYICHFRRFLVPMFVASNVCCFGVVLSDVWHSVICRSNVCRFFVCRSDVCNFVPMFVVLTFVVTMFVFPTFDFWTFAIPTFLCVPNTFMHDFMTNISNQLGLKWDIMRTFQTAEFWWGFSYREPGPSRLDDEEQAVSQEVEDTGQDTEDSSHHQGPQEGGHPGSARKGRWGLVLFWADVLKIPMEHMVGLVNSLKGGWCRGCGWWREFVRVWRGSGMTVHTVWLFIWK